MSDPYRAAIGRYKATESAFRPMLSEACDYASLGGVRAWYEAWDWMRARIFEDSALCGRLPGRLPGTLRVVWCGVEWRLSEAGAASLCDVWAEATWAQLRDRDFGARPERIASQLSFLEGCGQAAIVGISGGGEEID